MLPNFTGSCHTSATAPTEEDLSPSEAAKFRLGDKSAQVPLVSCLKCCYCHSRENKEKKVVMPAFREGVITSLSKVQAVFVSRWEQKVPGEWKSWLHICKGDLTNSLSSGVSVLVALAGSSQERWLHKGVCTIGISKGWKSSPTCLKVSRKKLTHLSYNQAFKYISP